MTSPVAGAVTGIASAEELARSSPPITLVMSCSATTASIWITSECVYAVIVADGVQMGGY